MFGSIVAIGFAVELLELAEFFLKRHPGEKGVDLFLYVGLPRRSKGGQNYKETEAQSENTSLSWTFEFVRHRSSLSRVSSGAKNNTSRRCAFVSGSCHRARS